MTGGVDARRDILPFCTEGLCPSCASSEKILNHQKVCQEHNLPVFELLSREISPHTYVLDYIEEFNFEQLAGKKILASTTEPGRKLTLDFILKYGGIPIMDLEQERKVINWPCFVNSKFTRRKIAVVPYLNIPDIIEDLEIFIMSYIVLCLNLFI